MIDSDLNCFCARCGRYMTARRRWQNNTVVRYCSKGCRVKRVSSRDRKIEAVILELLATRSGKAASICPSEVARQVGEEESWRELMEPVRQATRRLAHRGSVEVVQRSRVIEPGSFRGPVRIRKK